MASTIYIDATLKASLVFTCNVMYCNVLEHLYSTSECRGGGESVMARAFSQGEASNFGVND